MDAEDMIHNENEARIDNDPDNKISEVKDKVKKNPWMISTSILAIVVVILLVVNFTGGITGGVVGTRTIEGKLVDFLEYRGLDYKIENIENIDGLYQASLSDSQGQEFSVYITRDGNFIVSGVIPLEMETSTSEPVETVEEDWTVFENSLPEDLKQKILGFTYNENPTETNNERVMDFGYEECENNLMVFYHAGCGWCTRYYLVLVQAQQDYPNLTIYALDLSENKDIAGKYAATGTPANVIDCKYFASGYMDKDVLYEILDSF